MIGQRSNRSAPRLLRTSIAYTAEYKRFPYDGHGPSTLEELINSDRVLSSNELGRSKDLIESIIANKLSKYNHQPIVDNLDGVVMSWKPKAR